MFDFLAQLLYPKKCVKCGRGGDYICDMCFAGITFLDHQLCGVCQKGTIDGLTHPACRTKFGIDGIVSAVSYKGVVKKLIYQFKYPPYLSDLKGILGRLFYESIAQQEAFARYITEKRTLIIPVPLHPARLRKRGHNQAELLGRELSMHLKIQLVDNVLIRTKQTKPQFELKKEERIKNILGAFQISTKFTTKIKGKNIVLVDDISTTGATLRECAKVLKKSGVGKVLGVTLAHEG